MSISTALRLPSDRGHEIRTRCVGGRPRQPSFLYDGALFGHRRAAASTNAVLFSSVSACKGAVGPDPAGAARRAVRRIEKSQGRMLCKKRKCERVQAAPVAIGSERQWARPSALAFPAFHPSGPANTRSGRPSRDSAVRSQPAPSRAEFQPPRETAPAARAAWL